MVSTCRTPGTSRPARTSEWKIPVPGPRALEPDRVGRSDLRDERRSAAATDVTFKPGLYGEGTASEDRTSQQWVVMALDRLTRQHGLAADGVQGEPKEKRHIKATYANATPFTDGRYVVAFFGSQGLYAFDMAGRPVWKKDLGVLNTGAYDLPEYRVGHGQLADHLQEPGDRAVRHAERIVRDGVDVKTGKTVWKTVRKELPSWGTPTVFQPSAAARPSS